MPGPVTTLTLRFKGLKKAADEATESIAKTATVSRAVAPDPNAANVEKLRGMGSVGGFGPQLASILDNLQKLVQLQDKAWKDGSTQTKDLFDLALYIQKDVDFIRTWGGQAGQNFNFEAFKRSILEGAGKEAEKAVAKVVEREKRIGTFGFKLGASSPPKPAENIPQQISSGQVRG